MAGKLSGISSDLELILKDLEGAALTPHKRKDITKALNSNRSIKPHVIRKLLDICIQDPKDDMKYAEETLNIVVSVLRKIVAKETTCQPDLVPSMLKIIHMTKTEIYSSKSDTMKILYFKTLLAYPDEAFLCIEEDGEIMELLNLYMHQGIPVEIRVQPINLLHKYLKVLPPDKRLKFVQKGVDVWFLKLIPNVMILTSTPNIEIETSVQALEIVTDELLSVNYENNPNWQLILQSICTPQKYPAAMKSLLEKGNPIWHRLWIIFIKLLKGQITKIVANFGSPINSILPVTETAFKMEARVRCEAFLCWDALIDNLATETDEVYVNKRIKLLVIPLRSNNAKVEETVIAKFKTWWRLMCRFHQKVNRFSEVLLIPFLHFCFGKPVISNKPVIVPGLMSDKTKEYCMEAFVNILGHYDCKGCVTLPRLNTNVITAKCLIDNWKDLIYCLNVAMTITASSPTKLRGPLTCTWMSFVRIICGMPEDLKNDDNVRRDFFIGLLATIVDSIQNCTNEIVLDIALSDLILPLFNKDDEIQQLLLPKDEDSSIITKVLKILVNPSFEKFYKRYDMAAIVTKLKIFTDFFVEKCLKSLSVTDILLKESPTEYNFFVLWSCLTASLCEKRYSDGQVLCKMLLWPLKNCEMLTNVQYSSLLWCKLYDLIDKKDGTANINDKILILLQDYEKINSMFLLKVSLKLLKHKAISEKDVQCEKELNLVQHVISKVHTLDERISTFNLLMDNIQLISKCLLNTINVKMAKDIILLIKYALKLIEPEINNKKDSMGAKLGCQVEAMLTTIQKLIKHDGYASLKETVAIELIHCLKYFGQQNSLKPSTLAIMQILLNGLDNNHSSYAEINNIVESLKQCQNVKNIEGKFTTPIKVTPKHVKKEASIVNTVVENGEEFVVVKSNWKFNPKKLTDKQKEKFQRHREDIPALYQDLSQSQEEFKLRSWKTDSQDTTTSSKSNSNKLVNGGTNQEISSIFKNMPNTDVVPKILKNIIEKNDKSNALSDSKNENIKRTQSPVNKEGKTQKLALKDRVFRNVRNLIEKSNFQNNDQVEKATNDILKTPIGTSEKVSDTIINSAPSTINLERPSRVKRKPKKFEDLELLPLKRRRFSLGSSDSQKSDLSGYCSEDQETSIIPKNIKRIINMSGAGSDNQENETEHEHCSRNEKEFENTNENKNENENTNEHGNEYNNGNQNKNENEHKKENETETVHENTNETPATQIPEEVVPCANHLDNNLEAKKETQHENIANNDKSIDATCDLNLQKKENDQIKQSPADNFNVESCNQTSDQSKTNEDIQKSSIKKPRNRKSPIERILTIEMVEGHPYLNSQSEKRMTRSESPSLSRRKTLPSNLNKSKIEQKNTSKVDKRKEKSRIPENQNIDISTSSQVPNDSQDVSGSQDIIESSQDSTTSVMSVVSTKNVKLIPFVKLQNIDLKNTKHQKETRLSVGNKTGKDPVSNCEDKDDSEFPLNKTAAEYVQIDLTENMDTKPIDIITSDSDAVIVIKDDDESQIVTNTDDNLHEAETQDMTDINPEPESSKAVKETEVTMYTPDEETQTFNPQTLQKHAIESIEKHGVKSKGNIDESMALTHDDSTKTLPDSVLEVPENINGSSSTLSSKDEEQRKIDFLNNTLEISPIKTLSPVRDNKSPSPDSSSDYVVIKLTSPVHSNGQPYENCGSPEVFTDEKVSPDKRDQSPPRDETHSTVASPRSLSLKKNKPQVRAGGRAAQMLDLCVPSSDRLQTSVSSDKTLETEQQQKKPSVISQSARRNLRILYNSTNESNEKSEENKESENFLKFTRELPAADCSPSVPILKRKLSEITDEATVSPASKRKRVSFHDPPVSTTVCVKKYIEPCGIRSPQNSVVKRQERQLHSQLGVHSRSKKRLDTAFKLEKALTNAIESFNDSNVTPSSNEDTEMSSLEPTPFVEVVKNCELNDVDPICKELVDCKDPIDKIARDLSSSAMRQLLVKEFVGKIETVGDLAKMTELEVNRLCIKAPKVKVAKKVLTRYFKRITYTKNKLADVNKSPECEPIAILDKVQTDCHSKEITESPKEAVLLLALKENNEDPMVHSTNEIDVYSVKSNDIPMSLNLLEKSTQLKEQLDVPLEQCTADELPPTIDGVVNGLNVDKAEFVDMEMQTDFVSNESTEVQTESPDTVFASIQTDKIATISSIVQTDETGSKSTADIVTLLIDKPDFCEQLVKQLDISSKQNIADSLPINTLMDNVVQKISHKESMTLIDKLLDKHTSGCMEDGGRNEMSLSFMRDYVSERFSSKDLILFCSEVLKNAYNKNT